MQRGFGRRDEEAEYRYDFSCGQDNEKYSELEEIPLIDLPKTEKELKDLFRSQKVDLDNKTLKIYEYIGHYEPSEDFIDGEPFTYTSFHIDDKKEIKVIFDV